jgi:hypothetical protein
MICRVQAILFCVSSVVFVSSVASAQQPDTSSVCWRARPHATCKSWIITEAQVEVPMTTTHRIHRFVGGPSVERRDFETRLGFTGGVMFNTRSDRALGLTGSATTTSYRVEARQRRWLSQTNGVDLSAGVARARVNDVSTWANGLTTSAGISNTYIGADLRLDLMRAGSRTVSGAFATVRAGSRAGSSVAVAGIALAGFAIWALSAGGT